MRKIMWFAIGFAAACGLCAYGLSAPWIAPVILLFAVITAAVFVLVRQKAVYSVFLVLLGCILGMGWFRVYHNVYILPAAGLDGTEQRIHIWLTDYSEPSQYGMCVDGRTELDGKTYQIRAYVDSYRELEPGDGLYGRFRIRITTPDGGEEATYHRGNGLFLLAYETDPPDVYKQIARDWTCFPALLGREIEIILESYFPADTGPFAKALLLGDCSGLTYEQDTNLKLSGIRHVVAVSGLHVSILFAMVSTVSLKKRWLKALIGLPVLLLFAAMAGFTPSVTRACLMCTLMLLAMLTRRDYDGATALAFSSLVMLMMNPMVIISIAFQLSVGSVAGIYLFQKQIHTWLLSKIGNSKGKGIFSRLKRWFAVSVSVTLSAMTFTTPLSAFYFGTVSLVGILTNLLTLWVISFVFYGIIGVCLLSLIWSSAAIALAAICSVPIRYVLWTAKVLGSFPMAAVYTKSVYIILWLVFCYVLLLVFALQNEKKPLPGCVMAVAGLCVALAFSWFEPLRNDLIMTVLDVGHGQSILLQSEGQTILVDCGGDSDTQTADLITETLLSQGITRLDAIVITHEDRDHVGALENLLTRVDTDWLYLPYTEDSAYPNGEMLLPGERLILDFTGGRVTLFGPMTTEGGNENSLCVLLEQENCAILITGDRSAAGERALLAQTQLPDVDVLIAGHHGSKYSTCQELLEAVSPETVMISVGADNPYGTPGLSFLQRLKDFGCQVLRTDQLGTIIYRR